MKNMFKIQTSKEEEEAAVEEALEEAAVEVEGQAEVVVVATETVKKETEGNLERSLSTRKKRSPSTLQPRSLAREATKRSTLTLMRAATLLFEDDALLFFAPYQYEEYYSKIFD